MKNNQEIESWHDRKITAGQESAEQIDENLRTADLILLLVSADFLASRYCWEWNSSWRWSGTSAARPW